MHAYEVMKNLGEEFEGLYRPSAGAVYPTIQELEDEGYVIGEEKDGKTVYSINDKGMSLLQKEEERMKDLNERRKLFFEERKELNREIRNLNGLIMTNYRDLAKEDIDQITKILRDARKKTSDIIFK